MKIDILTTDGMWMLPYSEGLVASLASRGHQARLIKKADQLSGGDLAFFLSCCEMVKEELRQQYKNCLVVHASDLPRGRGWSPLSWQILEGKNTIPVTLFEAEDGIDSGDIYLQEDIEFNGAELIDDLRAKMAEKIVELCERFVVEYPEILSSVRAQVGEPTVYAKRGPADSELDINKTILEQFNLLRVVDNQSYPAYFTYKGKKFDLLIKEKVND